MKPFNLEEFKKNPSRKIVTRGGDPVQILCTTAKSTHPIVALIKYPLEYEEAIQFRNDGSRYNNESPFDLFFVPEKKVIWGNLYSTQLGTTFSGDFYKTEEAALKEKCKDFCKYITTFKVEWEE